MRILKSLTTMVIAVGLVILGLFFINNQSTTLTNDRLSATSGSTVSQAKEIVKSECNPDIWNNWNTLTPTEQEGKAGYAQGAQQGLIIIGILTIDLYINDALTDKQQITETAWHECGHAKIYNLPSDKVEEIHTRMLDNFSECLGYEDECFADSMAEYKTGKPLSDSYIGKPSNKEQLALAEEVWNATGEVSHKNPQSGIKTWISITSF